MAKRPTAAAGGHPPWQLAGNWQPADVFALQALARGEANDAQQKRALEFICIGLCEVERMSFYPGGEDGRRASDFAEGKRWVGLQVKRALRLRPDMRDSPTAQPKT